MQDTEHVKTILIVYVINISYSSDKWDQQNTGIPQLNPVARLSAWLGHISFV